MEKIKTQCPLCKGFGVLDGGQKIRDEKLSVFRKKSVLLLHDEGFSFREIMGVLGYKSPRSVAAIIENFKKK